MLIIVFIVLLSASAIIAILTPMVVPIMDIIYPLNEPRVKEHIFEMERFTDEQEHFYKIYFHSVMCLILAVITGLALSCFFATFAQQCIGLINLLR